MRICSPVVSVAWACGDAASPPEPLSAKGTIERGVFAAAYLLSRERVCSEEID